MPEPAGPADTPRAESFYLDDGRLVAVRRAAPADRDGLGRLGAVASHVLEAASREAPGTVENDIIVAEAPGGLIVGAAWLESGCAVPGSLHLRMQLDPHYRHAGLEAALAHAVAEDAHDQGCERLTAHVSYVASDILASLRAAGFNITSCTSFGGTAEVEMTLN